MLKELQTWAKLKCFSRKPRKEANNIIDTRWVIKFKWEQEPGHNGTTKKTIRARLTVRGFKDWNWNKQQKLTEDGCFRSCS